MHTHLRLRDTLYYRKSKLNLNYAKENFLRWYGLDTLDSKN